jgi:hypothetical protein
MRGRCLFQQLQVWSYKFEVHFFKKGRKKIQKVLCCYTVQFGQTNKQARRQTQANPSLDKTVQLGNHSLDGAHSQYPLRYLIGVSLDIWPHFSPPDQKLIDKMEVFYDYIYGKL